MKNDMIEYEQNIVKAFKDCCAINERKEGDASASPSEVTKLLSKRNHISPLDTVLDIEKIMRDLRGRGHL